MFGRFTQTATAEAIAAQFGLDVRIVPPFKPRYTISPSQHVVAIRHSPESPKREAVLLRWGLIPSWAKNTKIGNQCINANAETVAEKPSCGYRWVLCVADAAQSPLAWKEQNFCQLVLQIDTSCYPPIFLDNVSGVYPRV